MRTLGESQAGTRRLGIPTVQDRLIQQAVSQMLGAHFDVQMSQASYGFRPGRSAHQAIDAARVRGSGRELGVAGCRRGAWRMARHVVMHRALGTAKLRLWGLHLPWELAGAST